MIDPGEFRHRITIEKATEIEEDSGDETLFWATWETRHARLIKKGGGETVDADQQKQISTWEVTLWYDSDLLPMLTNTKLYRVVDHRSRTLNIVNVDDNQGNNDYLTIHCVEQT